MINMACTGLRGAVPFKPSSTRAAVRCMCVRDMEDGRRGAHCPNTKWPGVWTRGSKGTRCHTSGQPLYQPQPKWLELWKIHGDGWPPADEIGVCYSCYRFLHKTYNRWMRYCCSCTQVTPRLAREFRAKPGSGGGEWCGACRRDAERKEQQAKSKPVPVGEPPPLPRFSCARNTSFKVCYDDDCNHVEGDDDGPEHRHLSDFARSYTLENTRHRIESYNRTSCGQQLQGGGRCDGTMRVEEGTDGRSLDQQLVLVCQRCKHREIERNQLPLKVNPHTVMGDSSDVPHHTSTQVPTYPNTHHVKHRIVRLFAQTTS